MDGSPTANRRAVTDAAVFGAVLLWALRPIWGIDIFFHVAIGRQVAAHGIPTTDIFSAADADAAWTPFQLGYELLVAGVDAVAGLDGLRGLHAALIALAAVVLWRRLRELTQSAAASFLLLSLFVVLYDDRIRLRPHVVNLVFEVLLLLPLASGRLAPRGRLGMLWLFLASALWGSMHAMGALWLTATLGALWAGAPPGQRMRRALWVVVSLLGIASVPGTLGGVLHVLAIQGQWKEFVPELAPSWAFFAMGGAYGIVCGLAPWIALLVVGWVWLARPSPSHRPALLTATGLALAAVALARLGYYSVFAFALCWPSLRSHHGARLSASARALGVGRAFAVSGGVLLLALIALHVLPRFATGRINPWTTTLHPRVFPEREIDALAASGLTGRVYNELAWGGYLLYRLFPSVRVLSDGRITFAPDVAELLRREGKLPPELLAEVAHRRFGVDMLVWRTGRMPPNADWRLLIRGPLADVWVRASDGRVSEAAVGR